MKETVRGKKQGGGIYRCRSGSFMSMMPMNIQTISRTRQMMLTKMPRAAESPRAAMERTKPPSCTPICMGRKPMRLAKKVVSATMSTE